jgi:hypothetical protein
VGLALRYNPAAFQHACPPPWIGSVLITSHAFPHFLLAFVITHHTPSHDTLETESIAQIWSVLEHEFAVRNQCLTGSYLVGKVPVDWVRLTKWLPQSAQDRGRALWLRQVDIGARHVRPVEREGVDLRIGGGTHYTNSNFDHSIDHDPIIDRSVNEGMILDRS